MPEDSPQFVPPAKWRSDARRHHVDAESARASESSACRHHSSPAVGGPGAIVQRCERASSLFSTHAAQEIDESSLRLGQGKGSTYAAALFLHRRDRLEVM